MPKISAATAENQIIPNEVPGKQWDVITADILQIKDKNSYASWIISNYETCRQTIYQQNVFYCAVYPSLYSMVYKRKLCQK